MWAIIGRCLVIIIIYITKSDFGGFFLFFFRILVSYRLTSSTKDACAGFPPGMFERGGGPKGIGGLTLGVGLLPGRKKYNFLNLDD